MTSAAPALAAPRAPDGQPAKASPSTPPLALPTPGNACATMLLRPPTATISSYSPMHPTTRQLRHHLLLHADREPEIHMVGPEFASWPNNLTWNSY